jgi:heme exporter protein D
MDLGPHAAFIWASYAAVALVILALLGWLVLDGRRQQADLDAVEAESGRQRGDNRKGTP